MRKPKDIQASNQKNNKNVGALRVKKFIKRIAHAIDASKSTTISIYR